MNGEFVACSFQIYFIKMRQFEQVCLYKLMLCGSVCDGGVVSGGDLAFCYGIAALISEDVEPIKTLTRLNWWYNPKI